MNAIDKATVYDTIEIESPSKATSFISSNGGGVGTGSLKLKNSMCVIFILTASNVRTLEVFHPQY